MRALGWFGWAAISLLTTLVAAWSASRYWALDPERFFDEQVQTYLRNLPALLLHVVCGPIALFLGPFQFLAFIRRSWPRAHRAIGTSYFAMVFVGGAGGLWLARVAYGGFATRTGFALLALAWIATAIMALRSIRRGDVAAHRQWAIRCFALTFAGVTRRLWVLLLSSLLDWSFAEAYAISAWLCWVPNLLVAELIVRNHGEVSQPSNARSL